MRNNQSFDPDQQAAMQHFYGSTNVQQQNFDPDEAAAMAHFYGPQQNQNTNVLSKLFNLGKAGLSGFGTGLQNLVKTAQNLNDPSINPDAKLRNVLMQQKQNVSPIINADVAQKLGVKPGFGVQTAENLGQWLPSMALANPELGMAANVGRGAIMGGALDPNNPTGGATSGALSEFGGALASTALKYAPKNIVKESMGRLVPYAQGILNQAKKGYNVLDSMGDQTLIDPVIPTAKSAFPNIYSPEEAATYLQKMKGAQPANIDVLQESQSALQPSYEKAILPKFDQQRLAMFNQFGPGDAKAAWNTFLENPTANNAAALDRAWGRARTGKNPDMDNIYTQLRDNLRDNIIMPGVQKFGSSEDAENYGNAHMYYRQFKQMFGNSPEMENLAKGNIDPVDMPVDRYYGMLQKAKEAGNFDNPIGGGMSVPAAEYQLLQHKITNPSLLQNLLNKNESRLELINQLSPLTRTIAYGLQNPNK